MRTCTVAFILCAFAVNAQTYSYYKTDYRNGVPSAMLGLPGDQFKSTITFSNPTSGPINIHVKRTQKSVPLYWSLWYHYIQACSPSQDTITVKIPPFSSTLLTLHVKTDSVNPGIATASYKMYRPGYEDDAETFNLLVSTKLLEVSVGTEVKPGDIRIFPNPANGCITITATESKTTSITIYDALGAEKFKKGNVLLPHSVDFSEYPTGVYFVKVSYGNTAYTSKIIRN